MGCLISIATGAYVVCIQEARGTQEDQHEILDFLPELGTHMHDGSSGWLLFLLSPTLVRHYPPPQVDALVRGRIAVVRLRARSHAT